MSSVTHSKNKAGGRWFGSQCSKTIENRQLQDFETLAFILGLLQRLPTTGSPGCGLEMKMMMTARSPVQFDLCSLLRSSSREVIEKNESVLPIIQ